MRILTIGSGLVGSRFASLAREGGHHVIGTTTTGARLAEVAEVADEARLLVGSDADAVEEAARACDAIVVTAGPAAARAMTREDRAASYREVLVGTAGSVVATSGSPRLVMLSSLSVYGDAADGLDVIDEDAPTTSSDDPSPSNFLAAERTYLDAAGERTAVLRCADIFGADDPPIEAKVRMAHEMLGGSVPFRGDALFYRVHVDDVAGAILHALDTGVSGVFNLTHEQVPPTNRELFDTIGTAMGFAPLTFRDEIASPARPISSRRITGTGFVLSATEAATLPG